MGASNSSSSSDNSVFECSWRTVSQDCSVVELHPSTISRLTGPSTRVGEGNPPPLYVRLDPLMLPPSSALYPGQVAQARYRTPKRPGPGYTAAVAYPNPNLAPGEVAINSVVWRNALGGGAHDIVPGKLLVRPLPSLPTATRITLKSFAPPPPASPLPLSDRANDVKQFFSSFFAQRPVTQGDTMLTRSGLWVYVAEVSPGPCALVDSATTTIDIDTPSRDLDPEILAIVGVNRLHTTQRPVYMGAPARGGLTVDDFKYLPVEVVEKDSDENCGICVCNYEAQETVRVLPACKHRFHKNCIDRWLVEHDTCPLCRHSCRPR